MKSMFIRTKTLREILDHCYACTELLNEQQDRIESLERQIKEINVKNNIKKLVKIDKAQGE